MSDSDDESDEGVRKPSPEFDIEALAEFLKRVEPIFRLHLDANLEQRALNNYEVFSAKQIEESENLHICQTDFNFIQANQDVQKVINLEGGAASGSDDWDDNPFSSSAS